MTLRAGRTCRFLGADRLREAQDFLADLPADAHSEIREITVPVEYRTGKYTDVPALEVRMLRTVRGRFRVVTETHAGVSFHSPE